MCAKHGTVEDVDGHKKVIGEKMVEFRPMGLGTPNPDNPKEQLPPYGYFSTSDPEVIAHLDAHRQALLDAGARSDILTPEEYHNEVVPKTKQIGELKRRLMETETKLAAVLANQGKLGRKPAGREAG